MVDVDVRFNVGEDQPINADFEVQPDATFTADIEIETPIKDHDKLNNRDLPDQHPISAITGLETALNNESQAIAALDNKIEEEISRAEGAESVLDAKIEEEKTRATTAEDVLQNNIDAEETRAEAAEQANATAISDEENRARQAESDLNTAIQTETNRAESAESDLSDAISAETTRAEEAESTLQTNINNESSRAQQAETNLSTAISAEQTRAETAESGLSADISAEATARQNADMALQTNINTEITNRTNADTALGTRIDNETSARESADDTLQDNIDSEESTRASEISRVEGLISAETTRATNAEQVNATSISNHIADKNNPHEVSKAQVGLGNVDNTSDANKPISTATRTALNAIGDEIDTINSKIPAQASSTNQLADRDFVNSSVATNTADFIDTFASVSDLESYSGTVTNNDYAFVVNRVVTDNGNDWATFTALNAYDKSLLTNFDYAWVINGINFDLYRFDILQQAWDLRAENIEKDDVSLNITYNRYKATVVSDVVSWKWEYSLNNSSFTAEQWEAINSGATQDNIAQISVNTGNITTLSQTKQDNITSSNMLDADLVDDSTSANKFVTSADITNWNAKQNAISDLETIRSGAAKGATSVQSVIQGTTNGSINVDGSDVPVKGLGSAAYTNSTSYDAAGSASQAETNAKNYTDSLSTNYATAAQGIKADTAVQPSDLATVATSGSFTDLTNQPTIGNATLTIQKNGATVDTFTANSTVDKTVNITVPTNNNQLTNGAGYQTASDVATAISGKQDTLISGTNIKTINGSSVLGSGDLSVTAQTTWGSITGTLSNQADLQNALNTKQGTLTFDSTPTSGSSNPVTSGGVYTALNLKQDITTAVNYDNISNCITEIPQDIKLELNNGTLTLKAGSKVYVPNGSGVFDTVTITSDKSGYGTLGTTKPCFMFYILDSGKIQRLEVENSYSGTTDPVSGTWHLWYDTTNNICYLVSNTDVQIRISLPFAIVTFAGDGTTTITSIDQVFNGFGYIGSTVFALPGVKGLIPNGRNADGSLKNTEFETSSVLTRTYSGNENVCISLKSNAINWHDLLQYDEKNNINIYSGSVVYNCNAGTLSFTNGKITSLTPKTAFHAVDYNDFNDLTINVLKAIYPVGAVYIGTTSTCPLASFFGTWTLKSSGIVTSVNTNVPIKGNGMTLGLTNGTDNYGLQSNTGNYSERLSASGGSYGVSAGSTRENTNLSKGETLGITTDASKSGIVGTVTRSTYTVNIWERTA